MKYNQLEEKRMIVMRVRFLGKGIVNTKQIVDMARKSGRTSPFIVEQEFYQNKTALVSVKEDLAIMKRRGLEGYGAKATNK